MSGYDVYREAGETDVKVGSPTAASFAVTGLTPDTSYTFYVIARDGAGNSSTASSPVTFRTVPGPVGGGCTATYKVANSWPGGFQGEVTVKNTGTAAISAWTVRWSFPNGQTITQLWSGVHTQTGADVTVKNTNWNGSLAGRRLHDVRLRRRLDRDERGALHRHLRHRLSPGGGVHS